MCVDYSPDLAEHWSVANMLPSLQVCTYVATWYIPMCKYFSLIHYQHIHTGMYICSRKTSVQCVLMSHFLGEVESKIDLFIFFSEFCVRSHHFVLPTSFSIFPFHAVLFEIMVCASSGCIGGKYKSKPIHRF